MPDLLRDGRSNGRPPLGTRKSGRLQLEPPERLRLVSPKRAFTERLCGRAALRDAPLPELRQVTVPGVRSTVAPRSPAVSDPQAPRSQGRDIAKETRRMRVLVVDVGGTNVKILATGRADPRKPVRPED